MSFETYLLVNTIIRFVLLGFFSVGIIAAAIYDWHNYHK